MTMPADSMGAEATGPLHVNLIKKDSGFSVNYSENNVRFLLGAEAAGRAPPDRFTRSCVVASEANDQYPEFQSCSPGGALRTPLCVSVAVTANLMCACAGRGTGQVAPRRARETPRGAAP